ncbi:hypothetical protein BS50DRAFT_15662 [Corynespora cassiicola Philippines]|uniref:Uncharacterized protein n=1 Tax=Corynespora cassiicola Philippines TaxID=1448308 RepID=A0A2T2P9S5_CORCC|nr:hypothetical protein BS50DRAFT_15662 [Corynespora cassiicola Philippines]
MYPMYPGIDHFSVDVMGWPGGYACPWQYTTRRRAARMIQVTTALVQDKQLAMSRHVERQRHWPRPSACTPGENSWPGARRRWSVWQTSSLGGRGAKLGDPLQLDTYFLSPTARAGSAPNEHATSTACASSLTLAIACAPNHYCPAFIVIAHRSLGPRFTRRHCRASPPAPHSPHPSSPSP